MMIFLLKHLELTYIFIRIDLQICANKLDGCTFTYIPKLPKTIMALRALQAQGNNILLVQCISLDNEARDSIETFGVLTKKGCLGVKNAYFTVSSKNCQLLLFVSSFEQKYV